MKITTKTAIDLHNVIGNLGGPSSYFPLFKAVQKRIMETWPEIVPNIPTSPEDLQIERDLKLSIVEKSALAYQFAELFKKLESTFSRSTLMDLAEAIGPKFKAYVEKNGFVGEVKALPPSEIDDDMDVAEAEAS